MLPVPWFVRRWLAPLPRTDSHALEIPFLGDFNRSITQHVAPQRSSRWVLLTALLAWFLLVLAAARPTWLGEPTDLPASGRDLMLAVDLSGSMQTKDFKINDQPIDRLTIAKQVAADFIRRRVGDRTGLILFGAQAYLQAPLTLDRETTAHLLEEAVIGLAGKETAIGDAIGLAVKKIRESPKNTRALILLTDGVNNASAIPPIKAAQLAATEGIKIYAIGVGADEMMIRTLFGTKRVNPSEDLDEKALTEIATITHGRYFRAKDTTQLEEIYRLLDELEPVTREMQTYRPTRALFSWPLTLALLLAAWLAVRQEWQRVRP